jgi:formamidopyrimidine-DNA glycosylase
MPEMPEVETVRRGLEEIVIGKTVSSVTVTWPRIIQAEGGVEAFESRMPGQQLEKVGRVGKFLLFYRIDVTCIAHLRMEGK